MVLNLQGSGGHVVLLLKHICLMLDSKFNLLMTDCMAEDSVGREERESDSQTETDLEREGGERERERGGGGGGGGDREREVT